MTAITWPFILKLLLLLFPTGVAVFEVWRQHRKKKGLYWTLLAVTVACFVLSVSTTYLDSLDAEERRLQDERARQNEQLQLDRMEGKLGDMPAAQRYVDAVRAVSQQHAAESVRLAAERYFASETERRTLREEVKKRDEIARAAYFSRFQPVYELVLARFDAWLEEMRKRGIKFDVKTKDVPSVISSGQTVDSRAREVVLGGKALRLHVFPAPVEDGKILHQFQLSLSYHKVEPGDGAQALQLDLREAGYGLENPRPSRFRFKSYQGNAGDPITDSAFVSAIGGSIDEIFQFVIEESTAP